MSLAQNEPNYYVGALLSDGMPTCDCCDIKSDASFGHITKSEKPGYITILLSQEKREALDKIKNTNEFSRRQKRAEKHPSMYAKPNWSDFHYYPRYYFCSNCQAAAARQS
jgi:hypothetical protein